MKNGKTVLSRSRSGVFLTSIWWLFSYVRSKASIAQWQSVGLVNQRSWVQSSLEADTFLPVCLLILLTLTKDVTPTWFEHAAFWSGVRRATVAPRSQMQQGSTEIWTRIAGFKVQSANHYTMEPPLRYLVKFLKQIWQLRFVKNKNSQCFLPGSNRRPCACEAHVITTTLRKPPCSYDIFAEKNLN